MERSHHPGARSGHLWMATAGGAAALGLTLTLTSEPMPGAEPFTIEEVVDVVCLLLFGALGAELLRRGIAEGLGRALMFLGGLTALDYLMAGVGDALADGQAPPSVAAILCSLVGEAAFIGTFFLLVYAPLALFPTGQLPSRRWRWLTMVAAGGAAIMSVTLLLTPGLVDEDNPATGTNPLGVDALGGLMDALEVVATVLLAVTLAGGVAAFVVRWVRYRGLRRRQLAWFSVGVAAMVVGFATDLGGSVAVEVATAIGIFGTLLIGMGWPLLGPLGREAARLDEVDAGQPEPVEVTPSTAGRRTAP